MIYAAAVLIVVGVALYVAAPLGSGLVRVKAAPGSAQAQRLEHERALAVQALRDLEFDREMGKLSEDDYQALRTSLEARAMAALGALERLNPAPPRSRPQPAGAARAVRFCPQCGSPVGATHSYCAECGTALAELRRVSGATG